VTFSVTVSESLQANPAFENVKLRRFTTFGEIVKTLFGLALFFVSTTTFASNVFVTDSEIQQILKEAGIASTLVKNRVPFYMQVEDIFVGTMERDEEELAVKRWSLIKSVDDIFGVALSAEPYTLRYLNFQNGRQTDVYQYSLEKKAVIRQNGIGGIRWELSATCRASGPEYHSKNVIEMSCDEVRNLDFKSPQMIELLIKGIQQLKGPQQVGSLEKK
jgi:hypothetical protein